MDRLRQAWQNINRLEGRKKRVVILLLVVVVATWLSVCLLLFSALAG